MSRLSVCVPLLGSCVRPACMLLGGMVKITAVVKCPSTHATIVAYQTRARCPTCGAMIDWTANGYVRPADAQAALRALWPITEQDPLLSSSAAEDTIMQFLETFEGEPR